MKSDALKDKVKIQQAKDQIYISEENKAHLQYILNEFLKMAEWLGVQQSTIEDTITQYNKMITVQIQNIAAWEEELLKYTVKPIDC